MATLVSTLTDVQATHLEILYHWFAFLGVSNVQTNFKVTPLGGSRSVTMTRNTGAAYCLKLSLPIMHHSTGCDNQASWPSRISRRQFSPFLPRFTVLQVRHVPTAAILISFHSIFLHDSREKGDDLDGLPCECIRNRLAKSVQR